MDYLFKFSMQSVILISSLLLTVPLFAEDKVANDVLNGPTDDSFSIGVSTQTEGALSRQFSQFLGTEERAAEVISGLRQGTAFSLSSDIDGTSGSAEATGITIDPPTGTLGYGNVKMTLNLAESKLQEMGISQPTSEQLSAVLIGGEINGQSVEGILTMRADGMGWGEIAHQYDTQVGKVMGRSHATTVAPVTSQTSTAGRNGYMASHTVEGSSGVITHPSNGYVPNSKGGAVGGGIMTGSGDSVQLSGYTKQNGKAYPGKSAYASGAPHKNGYISGSSSRTSTAVSSAAIAGTMGKAKGHINKK